MAELKLQLTSEVKSTSQRPLLIKNLRERFSNMYEGKPMATFKTLDECEAIGKLLELEGVAFRQKVLRKNSNVSKPYAIIILSKI